MSNIVVSLKKLLKLVAVILFCTLASLSIFLQPATAQDSRPAASSGGTRAVMFPGAHCARRPTAEPLLGKDGRSIQKSSTEVNPGRSAANGGAETINPTANMQAIVTAIASSILILGISWGTPAVVWGFFDMASQTKTARRRIVWGLLGIGLALLAPVVAEVLKQMLAEACLFS